MQCPQCQRENPPHANFCLHCGTRLATVCPQCQQVLPPEAKFCLACGHALTAVLPPAQTTPVTLQPGTPPTPQAERRQLTVLFCDLADSTRLARQLDPEDLREVMRAYQATCVDVIQRFAGHVAQYLGDGLLVYFGYPQAHEDDAQRAVHTGLGMLEAMAALNTRLVQDKGIRLAVRIGIHTGLVVIGEMGSGGRHEHLALGDTPNLAARLQGLAEPDTVVISAATSRLVQGYFVCRDCGVQALKGLDTPVQVYQVMGESAAQSRLDVAGRTAQAIAFWQRAGQQACQRFANPEAVRHLTTGLELLVTLPETTARAQQELDLQIALGPALMVTEGVATPEVEQVYTRARVLCHQIGETPQLFPTLRGLRMFYLNRGALPRARELGEQLLRLAQNEAAPTHLMEAHVVLGTTLFLLGEYTAARMHLEQGIALTDLEAQRALALGYGVAPGVTCLAYAAWTLWCLGYPAQAVRRSQEALALAQALAHPYSLAAAQYWAAFLYHRRREVSAVQAQAEALLTLATVQRFPLHVGWGACWRGWTLAMQGQGEAGLAQMHQGMAAVLAAGQTGARPLCLVLLAEAAGHAGQVAEGLRLLAEVLTGLETNEQGDMQAEAYRLQGELLLCQAVPDAARAEACFQQALTIARRQQAKSWELRAAMSLARLWQQQGKRIEAHELLAPVYGWFTEGFDTADLRDATVLLDELQM